MPGLLSVKRCFSSPISASSKPLPKNSAPTSFPPQEFPLSGRRVSPKSWEMKVILSATKMTGRPGHWSEPGEYNILCLGSILVISSQDSSALGYREFTQEGAMTISPFAAREGTSGPQWPNVKKCCRHLVPSRDLFVQSYVVVRAGTEPSERKRHINSYHINFLCRPSSPGLSQGQTQRNWASTV